MQLLAQPHLLQGDIVLQMGQLRFHGDAVTLTGNAVTQGLAQQGRHIGDGVLLVEVGLGADRFQRVVHEMGVDLGAHQLHFRLGQRQVALVDLLDQGLNVIGHHVEGFDQSVHFVTGARVLYRGKVLVENAAAYLRQLVDGLLDAARDHPRKEQHRGDDQRQQDRQHHLELEMRVQTAKGGAETGNIPVGQSKNLPDGLVCPVHAADQLIDRQGGQLLGGKPRVASVV